MIRSLGQLEDKSLEKSTLLVLLLHKALSYFKNKKIRVVIESFRKIFDDMKGEESKENSDSKEVDQNKRELLSCLYNFISTFQHPEAMPGEFQLVVTNIDQTVKFIHESYRDRSNLDDTEANCIVNL